MLMQYIVQYEELLFDDSKTIKSSFSRACRSKVY